jgi:hypothetical protein
MSAKARTISRSPGVQSLAIAPFIWTPKPEFLANSATSRSRHQISEAPVRKAGQTAATLPHQRMVPGLCCATTATVALRELESFTGGCTRFRF